MMRFERATLEGVWIVDLAPSVDDRGSFARTYCREEFAAHQLHTEWPQANVSRNTLRGTLRGMHFQGEPQPEVKLVRCSAGAIFDVVVDVRRSSFTFGQWFGLELTAATGRALYVPAGFAHGFQTLTDNAEVSYLMGSTYAPGLARGLRWNDSKVAVTWPIANPTISRRDQSLPLLPEIL